MEKKSSKKNLVITIGIIAVAFIFLFFYAILNTPESLGLSNVALIKVDGVITTEDNAFAFEGGASSTKIVKNLKDAEENSQVKAVVLEINSPGGSAVASEEIAKQVNRMNKPVIAVIRDVGASGGYWIASSADEIVASPVSITGSIGVTASYLEFGGLLEKYGVRYEELTAGEHKDMGSPFRNLTTEERALFRKTLQETRDYFVYNVANNRNMSFAEVDKLATGQIYLGKEAKEVGLIDELGGIEEAEKLLKEKYGIERKGYYEYEDEDLLLGSLYGVISRQSYHVGEGIGNAISRRATTTNLKITT